MTRGIEQRLKRRPKVADRHVDPFEIRPDVLCSQPFQAGKVLGVDRQSHADSPGRAQHESDIGAAGTGTKSTRTPSIRASSSSSTRNRTGSRSAIVNLPSRPRTTASTDCGGQVVDEHGLQSLAPPVDERDNSLLSYEGPKPSEKATSPEHEALVG